MTLIKKVVITVLSAILFTSTSCIAEINYDEANYELTEREQLNLVAVAINQAVNDYNYASSIDEKKIAASYIFNAFTDNNAVAYIIQQVLSESRYKVNKDVLREMLALMAIDVEAYPHRTVIAKSISKAHIKTAMASL